MDRVAFGCHFVGSDGHGTVVAAFTCMRWLGLLCCYCRGYAMDLVVLVAISRVSDGLEKLVVTLTGMRWMWLCCCHCRGYAKHMFAFSCQFVGMRWMGLSCCHYRGYAMDIVAFVSYTPLTLPMKKERWMCGV